jgi:hypothetical protein
LVAPTLNASGAPTPNTGVVLHSTTMLIGLLIVAAMLYFALKATKEAAKAMAMTPSNSVSSLPRMSCWLRSSCS